MATRGITLLFIVLSLSACHTVFDYSSPSPSNGTDTIKDAATGAAVATEYAQAYDDWAKNLAWAPQALELPIIGTAIGTAAELAFSHPHVGPATSLALAGAGLYALDNYWAARDRMAIYLAGSQAMRCVAGVAQGLETTQVNASFRLLSTASLTVNSFRDLSAQSSDPLTVSILATAAATADSVPGLLRDAIDQINTKVVTSAANKSTNQNPTQIISALKDAIKNDTQKQQQTIVAVQNLVDEKKITQMQASAFMASAAAQALQTVDSDLKTCIAKAGT